MSDIDMDDVVMIVEIRGVYDGWSYAIMNDGHAVNRWEPGDPRWEPTEVAVAAWNAGRDSK